MSPEQKFVYLMWALMYLMFPLSVLAVRWLHNFLCDMGVA